MPRLRGGIRKAGVPLGAATPEGTGATRCLTFSKTRWIRFGVPFGKVSVETIRNALEKAASPLLCLRRYRYAIPSCNWALARVRVERLVSPVRLFRIETACRTSKSARCFMAFFKRALACAEVAKLPQNNPRRHRKQTRRMTRRFMTTPMMRQRCFFSSQRSSNNSGELFGFSHLRGKAV